MKKLIFLFLSTLSWNTLSGQITDPQSIYNGEPVDNAATAPWVVQIRRASDAGVYRVSCTGVIIGDRHVLTAAHCVTCNNCDYPESTIPSTSYSYRVLFGTTSIDSEDPDYSTIPYRDISNVYIHGEYNGYASHDIAILEFDTPITFTSNRQPIDFEHACHPINDGLNDGNEVKIYGWGHDYDGDGQAPDVLQSGVLEITQLNTSNIIARLSGDDSVSTFGTPCSGDSGGPLIREVYGNNVLVGILSTGNGGGENCPNGTQGEWERVSYYSPFIDYYLNNQCKPKLSHVENACYPQPETISLINSGNNTTTWTSSSNVQITSSNNSSANYRASNSTVSGNGWIKAVLSNGIELTREFWVGKPILYNAKTLGPNHLGCNSIYIYDYRGSVRGASTTRWIVSLQFDNISSINGYELFVDPTNEGEGFVTFVASNDCGENIICKPVSVSGWSCGPGYINFPTQYSCGDGGGFIPFRSNEQFENFIIFPNPTSAPQTSILTTNQEPLSIETSSGSKSRKHFGEIKIDIYRIPDLEIVYSNTFEKEPYRIDTSQLKSGKYYCVITQGKTKEVKRIIVE